jgi:hypothetical protein
MRKSLALCVLVIFSTLLASSTSCRAVPIWSWDFDQPHQIVLPTDVVVFTATLYNDPASTDTIYGTFGLGPFTILGTSCCNAALLAQYQPDVQALVELAPAAVAPGESFTFVYAQLVPYPVADPGTYMLFARLNLSEGENLIEERYSDTVGVITVVPEPSSALLVSIGLVSLGATPLVARRANRCEVGTVASPQIPPSGRGEGGSG